MESKSQIGFDHAGLGSILKQNLLVVPPNQREYAWTDRQVTQLFQDFARALNEGAPYFLGTIVTIPHVDGSLEVVDGQQRLATTAILLAAIRNYLKSKGEEILVESIENEFLTGIDRRNRVRIPRLRLNVSDNELFAEIIVSGSHDNSEVGRESHQNLVKAAINAKKQVLSVVASLDPRDHGDHLNRWVSFIEHNAQTVLLRVPHDADAYKMFETLNDRGLRSSQADLIKNFVFGRSKGRLDEAQVHWAYMRGALESLEDDDISTVTFLRHALIVQKGFLREAEVFDVVQDQVKSESIAIGFLTTLETLSYAYVSTFNPEHARWNQYSTPVRRAIEVFNLLDIKPMRPLILAITDQMGRKEIADSFQFLVSLGVRLLVASTTRSQSVEQPLAEAARSVYQREIDTAAGLRKKLSIITPSDSELQAAFETIRVSNSRFARYYLRSLERTSKGESEPWYIPTDDNTIINLEHILPKKPMSNWPDFTEDDLNSYCNRLGNQTLMKASDNSKSKSDAFSEKRSYYRESPYKLTSMVAEVDAWTPASIVERQSILAALSPKTWPIRS